MKIVDYSTQSKQMGDLLAENGISPKSLDSDFLEKMLADLNKYIISGSADLLEIPFANLLLQIKGIDEASYLYDFLTKKGAENAQKP